MRRLSLTATLSGAFALITVVTFYFAGSYLYDNLLTQLLRNETTELVLKVQHLRSLAADEDSAADLRAHASRIVSQIAGNDAFVVQFRSSDNQMLLEFNPLGLPVIALAALPDGTAARDSDLRQWRTESGGTVRGVAAQARLHNGEVVTLVLGRSLDDVMRLLRNYRDTIIRTVAFGALAAMGLSYLLVRRALLPLHRITQGAGRITIDGLNTRLDDAHASPELRDLSVSLNGMLARLQAGFELLSNYTENLAHDLRTPVNNLRGQTEVALSRPRSVEEYQALLASNLEEYERLTRMIENILFLARAGNAQIALRRTELDAAEQLQQVAGYFEGLAEEGGASLRVRAHGKIKADAVLFRRALSNLLSNALRYTPSGGVIELTAAQVPGGTLVGVSNPGPDIPPEQLDKVFERFYRGDEARSNSADSTGLGLAIVRSVMDLHQGKALAESSRGLTRFSLLFPDAPNASVSDRS
ncbi:MAG TPA: heavy metal sensor histidine kinase [Burkholderiaceae bacterium]|jgi:two-component system heavy metal sensor histidine kinase CusS|nr:heavy metal sensor histidine kinase [Burkholderiaceae bacterium]